MTYNVFMGTLNPTHSLTLSIIDEQTDGRTEGQKAYSKHPRPTSVLLPCKN